MHSFVPFVREPKHTCQDPTPGQTNKAQAHTDRQTQKLENMYLEIKTMPLQLKWRAMQNHRSRLLSQSWDSTQNDKTYVIFISFYHGKFLVVSFWSWDHHLSSLAASGHMCWITEVLGVWMLRVLDGDYTRLLTVTQTAADTMDQQPFSLYLIMKTAWSLPEGGITGAF